MYTTNITLTLKAQSIKCKQLHKMLKLCTIPDTFSEMYLFVEVVNSYLELSNTQFIAAHYGCVPIFAELHRVLHDWDLLALKDIFECLLNYMRNINNIDVIDVFMHQVLVKLALADLDSIYNEILDLVEECSV